MDEDETPEEKVIEIPTNRRNRRWYARQKRRTHLKDTEREREAGKLAPHPVPKCDWPGCEEEWVFVTHATVGKKKTVQARRCVAHRLAQS